VDKLGESRLGCRLLGGLRGLDRVNDGGMKLRLGGTSCVGSAVLKHIVRIRSRETHLGARRLRTRWTTSS
jgi:hypothetical protein